MTSGLGTLVRLALRRDRVVLPIWITLLGLLPASGIRGYETFYPSAAERAGLTAAIRSNPAVAVIYGPAFDLSTASGFTAWRFGGVLAVVTALMAMFTVTRHTRADEESGRSELLAAGTVGRYAFLAAAAFTAGAACLAVGVVQIVVLAALGAPGGGAVCFGLSTAGAGLVFTGVAAVTAQVCSFSRSANGSAAAVLGLAFLLRAIGDSTASGGWLSWISPIGWVQQSRAFADERWWVLTLPLLAASALFGIAVVLVGRRDLGRGMLPSRPSPAVAGPSLSGVTGLGWRLQRATALGWVAALLIAGAMLGSIAAGIGDLVGDSEQTQEVFERMGGTRGLVQAYLATICGLFGMLAGFVPAQSVVHLRREETEGRAEPVLATAARRGAWAGGHLAIGVLASALAVVVAGLAAGVTHGLRTSDVAGATGACWPAPPCRSQPSG